MVEQEQQPKEQKSKTTEKDSILKRMGRGFKVMFGKAREVAEKMNEGNKSSENKDSGMTGTDMSYAPVEFQ